MRPNISGADCVQTRYALRQVPPCSSFCSCPERPWQNKPSEVSFDSRRGATLETFSSRNEQTGPGGHDEASKAVEKTSPGGDKPIAGLLLPRAVVTPLQIAPESGNSEGMHCRTSRPKAKTCGSMTILGILGVTPRPDEARFAKFKWQRGGMPTLAWA